MRCSVWISTKKQLGVARSALQLMSECIWTFDTPCKRDCLHPVTGAMIRENQQLVADEPVEVQDSRKITVHFRGICKIHPNSIKENPRMSTCNWLDLQSVGSRPIMPKNLPNHWTGAAYFWPRWPNCIRVALCHWAPVLTSTTTTPQLHFPPQHTHTHRYIHIYSFRKLEMLHLKIYLNINPSNIFGSFDITNLKDQWTCNDKKNVVFCIFLHLMDETQKHQCAPQCSEQILDTLVILDVLPGWSATSNYFLCYMH
jgi:hypothetical protein